MKLRRNRFRKHWVDGILRWDTLWFGRLLPSFLNNLLPPYAGKVSDLLHLSSQETNETVKWGPIRRNWFVHLPTKRICMTWIELNRTSLSLFQPTNSQIYFTILSLYGPGWLSRYSDSLRAGRSGDRIPVGARFSAPVQTSPGAYPASCTMGTGSFPGVKRPGRGADHPPPSKCRGHERVGLYLYSPSGPQWPVMGRTFTFYCLFI